ncbi:MAG: hypothetical protein B6I25_07740 [Planctomycetales bacterium 4572_13]|nr:MAG: hypothetical protein B6I25_07740 [Planctomycetales bacterium 4572_13]
MSISFHCEACKKKIKAPDSTGGKWGNCPFCQHRCYVPSPKTKDEAELTLEPLNANEEKQMEELMQQTHMLTQSLLGMEISSEKESDPGKDRTAQEKDVIKKCIIYLRQMADGELAAAAKTFSKLKETKKISIRTLSSMGRAERPEPELADLSDGVLQGLIRDACTELS